MCWRRLYCFQQRCGAPLLAVPVVGSGGEPKRARCDGDGQREGLSQRRLQPLRQLLGHALEAQQNDVHEAGRVQKSECGVVRPGGYRYLSAEWLGSKQKQLFGKQRQTAATAAGGGAGATTLCRLRTVSATARSSGTESRRQSGRLLRPRLAAPGGALGTTTLTLWAVNRVHKPVASGLDQAQHAAVSLLACPSGGRVAQRKHSSPSLCTTSRACLQPVEPEEGTWMVQQRDCQYRWAVTAHRAAARAPQRPGRACSRRRRPALPPAGPRAAAAFAAPEMPAPCQRCSCG